MTRQFCLRIFSVNRIYSTVPCISTPAPTTRRTRKSGRGIHVCPKCTRIFSWPGNLQEHLRYICGQPPRFNCPYCTYKSRLTSNVRAHVRRQHPNQAIYCINILTPTQ